MTPQDLKKDNFVLGSKEHGEWLAAKAVANMFRQIKADKRSFIRDLQDFGHIELLTGYHLPHPDKSFDEDFYAALTQKISEICGKKGWNSVFYFPDPYSYLRIKLYEK